jgi:glycosyltransferase involved in cell wall biosynthesis
LLEPYPFDVPQHMIMANPMRLERTQQRMIGITTWETTRIPADEFEKPLTQVVDELIVPCRDNIELFQELCPDMTIHYIPEGIDTDFWIERPRDWFADGPLRICMFGALTYRKGIDLGVEAFIDLYGGNPDVELHIGTTFYELPIEMMCSPYDNIHIHNFGWSTREQVREFYCSMHGMFAPFRGEGFFLPGAEFMATGGCFIAPDKMGPAAYHGADKGWVIPCEYKPVKHWGEHHGIHAARYGDWLEYDGDALRDTLRAFVESEPAEKKRRATNAAGQIPFLCDPDRAAQQTIDVFLKGLLEYAS